MGAEPVDDSLERARAQYGRVLAFPPVATPVEAVQNARALWIYAMQVFEAIGAGRILPSTLAREVLLDTNGVDVVARAEYTPGQLNVTASNAAYAALDVLAIATDSALDALGRRPSLER